MNASRKSWIWAVLVLVLTFGMGVFTGGGIVNAIVEQHLEEWRSLSTAEGFAKRVRDAIGPVPGHRRPAMDRVILDTGQDLAELLARRRSEYGTRVDEMEQQLSDILTREQLNGWLRLRARDLENARQRHQSGNGK